LYRVGLEKEALVCQAQCLDEKNEQRARILWDGVALNSDYAHTQQRLEQWMARANDLELATAARESFLLGQTAIRKMIYDPLLPTPLVDVQLRQDCLATVQRFDQLGHEIWRRLLVGEEADT